MKEKTPYKLKHKNTGIYYVLMSPLMGDAFQFSELNNLSLIKNMSTKSSIYLKNKIYIFLNYVKNTIYQNS